MKTAILVAGGTGNLGGRIVNALLEKSAEVRVLVRSTTDQKKVQVLEDRGVQIVRTDFTNINELTQACKDVSCVVSALQGLHDVIVDAQTLLLHAAVAAGVPRFIPSDFSSDFTNLPAGENRNFDIRREFYQLIDQLPIAATSVFNGAFAEILSYGTPLLDQKKKTVGYWENADWQMDFTTMDDTATFTAAAALDTSTPRKLQIASFQISPNELAKIAAEVKNTAFQTVRMGSLKELAEYNKRERAAHPEGETELYPRWQSSQYIQSMFSTQNNNPDNNLYPDLKWQSAADFIASI